MGEEVEEEKDTSPASPAWLPQALALPISNPHSKHGLKICWSLPPPISLPWVFY